MIKKHEYFEEIRHVKYVEMPMMVNNKPSENVSIMIGILHVAFIDKQEDGQWKVTLLWPHAFQHESNLFPNKKEAIFAVKQRLFISIND